MKDALLIAACFAVCAAHWLIEAHVNAPFRAFVASVLLRAGVAHGMALFDACRTAITWRRGAPWWLRLSS